MSSRPGRPSTKLPWKHVRWVPAYTEEGGTNWKAFSDTRPAGERYVGTVRKLRSGRYECIIRGFFSHYEDTMRRAAVHIVANVNNIYPGQVP